MARMLWIFVFLKLLENVVAQGSNKKQAPTITTQPSNTLAAKGGIVELKCTASGTPPLNYKWHHENKVIKNIDRRFVTSNGNLFIARVFHKKKKGSDMGSYYCVVYNDYGVVKSNVVNITLGYIRRSFRLHPVSQSVPAGGMLTLSCIPPRGRPKPELKWLKNDHTVTADGSRISFGNKKQKLVIKNFGKDDEGSYKCEASNLVGRKLSNPASIVRIVPPVFVDKPKDKIVAIGVDHEARFKCKAEGNPKPKIEWKKEGNQTVLPSTDGELILTNLKISNEGIYICSASNAEGTLLAKAQLTVNYLPRFTLVSPDANVQEGSTLRLSCLANAQPAPSIIWFQKNGTFFKPHERYGNIYVNQDDRTVILVISSVKKSDEGTYTCKATNEIGSDERHVKFSVHSKSEFAPIITSTNTSSVTADINTNQRLICDVDGSPKPLVHWSKVGSGKNLGGGTSVSVYPIGIGKTHRYVLDIVKVQESDAGTFQCLAVNRINTDTKDFVLKVTSKLRLTESIGVGVPPMPSSVSVSGWTHNSVLISWNKITTSAVDHVVAYAVGYINIDTRTDAKYASFSISPSRDRFMVIDLQPDTRYRFFVRAVNKNGPGPPSLLSNIVKTNAVVSTTSVLPTIVEVRQIKLKINVRHAGPGELVISWKKFRNFASIDGYYIYWKANDGIQRRETLQNNRAKWYTISDLQNSTTYEVKVQVYKNKSTGLMSDVVYQKTSNQVIVLAMDVRKNDTDSFVVTWQRLWKKDSGVDRVKDYTIWYAPVNNVEEKNHQVISADVEKYHFIVGGLTPGEEYKVWMVGTTVNGHRYFSEEKHFNPVQITVVQNPSSKSLAQEIKLFVLQPWFLGLLGGLLLLLIIFIIVCCFCKRSSSKKDDLPIPLQDRNKFESIRKPPSETANTESDMTSRSRGRETGSDGDNLSGRSSRDYRRSGSPSAPTPTSLDFPQVAITPNRLYRSPDGRPGDEGNSFGRPPRTFPCDFDSPSRYNSRARNPYSPSPKPGSLSADSRGDNGRAKYPASLASTRVHSPSRCPYADAPPDYETAIAEKTPLGEKHSDDQDDMSVASKDLDDNHIGGRLPYQNERCGKPSSRQVSRSPGSECSNQGSSIAGRRKGLKPLPRLTIASVNWADMLPPPPSHPPPSSVATRSPPPSPTGTSMCSETTYGRSHASSFLPRRSASVVSGDMMSDLERTTADSVLSGKSKGKSESKLPFDLAGITSDIIMQWADSVTNTSGSDNDSQCSSPSRVSGISSDGSFLTDTDFANAVKAAAECGGFNIDIDLNMYKDMDPISFQPFAGSLSTYNPDNSGEPNKDSKPCGSTSKVSNSKDVGRDGAPRSGRSRRPRTAGELSRDSSRPGNSSFKETSPLITPTTEPMINKKPRKANELNANGSAGYVPALTRTSALGKLEPVPVNRGPVKKKYAVVKTLPQVQPEEGADYPGNYPSHSLSSSTSNASTIRSSSCPPTMLTDDDMEDDMLLS